MTRVADRLVERTSRNWSSCTGPTPAPSTASPHVTRPPTTASSCKRCSPPPTRSGPCSSPSPIPFGSAPGGPPASFRSAPEPTAPDTSSRSVPVRQASGPRAVYLLPGAAFEPSDEPAEWLATEPVTPLAVVPVTPTDFPFRDRVLRHVE